MERPITSPLRFWRGTMTISVIYEALVPSRIRWSVGILLSTGTMMMRLWRRWKRRSWCSRKLFSWNGLFNYPFTSYEEWDQVSKKCKNFIKKLLTKNPEKRYSAEQALNDPWIAEGVQKEVDIRSTKKYLNNLSSFRATQKLQQATWCFIVKYFHTRKDTVKLN